jgi:hypothetical protein
MIIYNFTLFVYILIFSKGFIRNFGTQMSTDTKLDLNNITLRVALNNDSKIRILKQKRIWELKAAQVHFLGAQLGLTGLDRQQNSDIRERLKVKSIAEEVEEDTNKF